MTEASKPVFLSYASQDAEAARRICGALRAAGIEVWFDQRELRGGDAWDALIRRRIKGCYLFVPIVSANTQAREEGYFRREWRLAVDRTNDMAEDRAFLLPVVIDGTSESEARVPEKFREVQWTRLPPGENANALVEHVRRLVSTETPVAVRRAPQVPPPLVASPRVGSDAASTGAVVRKSRSIVLWLLAGLAIIGGGFLAAERLLKESTPVTAAADTSGTTQAATVDEKSVAVLPFADMSQKKDQEYFADGLADELIEQLSRTPGLKVIARTSSFSFKGKSDDIATIAAKLNVANVLEGSVRRSGDRLRVTTELVRAASAQPVWSQTFDRSFKDVFAIQDEISTAVVSALRLKLDSGAGPALAHGTTNPDAYNAYLLGLKLGEQDTEESRRAAIESYRQAIRLDPQYAAAYADKAATEFVLGDHLGDPALEAEADKDVDKALELDPSLVIGYSNRASLRVNHFNWSGAESDYKRALQLEPNNPHALSGYANFLALAKYSAEAVQMYRKAVALDPLSPGTWAGLATVLTYFNRYAEAQDASNRAFAIAPNSGHGNFIRAVLQLLQKKPQETLAMAQQSSDDVFRLAAVSMAQHSLGQAKESQQSLEMLISKHGAVGAYQIGEAYAWRGEKDSAFDWLERAFRQGDPGLVSLKADPLLTSLHDDTRYSALLQKLNFPQ